MKKRILSLILSAVLILSMFMLASCGQRKLSRMNDEDLVEYLSEHLDGNLRWEDDELVYTGIKGGSLSVSVKHLREEVSLLEEEPDNEFGMWGYTVYYILRDDLRKIVVDYYNIEGIVTEYGYY